LAPGCHFVPRCRKMILPARTDSPPNFFTPRRLDSESRPLRDEPPAFLCAMICSLYAVQTFVNAYAPDSRAVQASSLLCQFLRLVAPVPDLVGAERHGFVDSLDILVP